MALQETEFLEYDMDGHYYYLTELGIETLTDVGNEWGTGTVKRANMQARLLHQEMTDSRYNSRGLYRNQEDLIEYKIFLNLYNEVDAIQNALITFAELSEYNDLDLDIRSGEKDWPITVTKPLRNAKIYFKGEMQGIVPEDEYRVGY